MPDQAPDVRPHADALRRDAETLLRTKGGTRAIRAYERLVEVDAARADDWFNLGYLRRGAGDWTRALAAYGQALELGVAGPEEAHLNRAVILSEHLFDAERAEEELGRALAIRPDYVPALLNLANLREDRGERDAARATYRRVLAIEPACARALGRLAEMAGSPQEIEAALGELDFRLAAPNLSADDRAELLFARGRALERLGRFADAFAAVAAANETAGGLAARTAGPYRADERERMVDAVMAEAAGPTLAGDAPAPLFLCGMFRSGTTVLEQVLAAHPQVCGGGELDALPRLVAERLPRFPKGSADLGKTELEAMRAEYLVAVDRLGCAGRLVVDKRPDNFLYLGLAKRLFPTARVLITRRHPLDTVLSNYFLRFDDSVSYSFRVEDAAHWLVQERHLAAHWMRTFPNDVLEVDYDMLVVDPEPAIRRILRFLGLPWDEACLRFHERAGVIRTPSGWQAREPLHPRSSGRWRRYRAELAPAAAVLGRAGLTRD